ncbi:MAG TPA: hypothetical protein VN700_09325 [Vicinamibacterales bacterium]|nr:hypothetical protein [Vicinamibacterales bacterium]
MSERTAPSLVKLDELLAAIKTLPASSAKDEILETTEALRRAVAAFHMEAIRFRMYSVERQLRKDGNAKCQEAFESVRHELETAGFHTRSHAAPGQTT